MSDELLEDWEIWAGVGGSIALLVPANDPDRPWLTRLLTRKYRMEGVTASRAWAVFERALRGGFLIPKSHNAVQPQHPTEGRHDAP